jgi:23S rRNA (cytosine1962-C5)-methyltransferase
MQALLNAIAQMVNTTDAHRAFHGRGGAYPDSEQWTLDWFAPVWVLRRIGAVPIGTGTTLANAGSR